MVETDRIADAQLIMQEAEEHNCQVLLPTDVVVGNSLDPGCTTKVQGLFPGCCSAERPCIAPGMFGGDIGPEVGRILRACSRLNHPANHFFLLETLSSSIFAHSQTVERCSDVLASAKTIFMNGPMGKFETPEYLGVRAW